MGWGSNFKRGGAVVAAVAGMLCLDAVATAARPPVGRDFGRNGIAFHHPPRESKALRVQVSVVDLARAGRGRLIAAIASGVDGPQGSYTGVARFNADGSIDRSFGRRGFAKVTRARLGRRIGLTYGEVDAVAVAPDGKILLAGFRYRGPDSEVRYPVLVRLLPDGSLDPGFGRSGVVTPKREADLGEWFSDVVVEPGGRIVAVGAQTQLSYTDGRRHLKPATLVRAFLPDGSVDRTFAENGTLRATVHRGRYYTAIRTVHVLPDGKLLLSGYRRYKLLLQRLTSDGRLDPSFGAGGTVVLGREASNCFYLCEQTSSLIVTGQGRILVQAHLAEIAHTTIPTLVRFLPNGRVDRSFGRNGLVRFGANENLYSAEAIAPARRGRFIVVGPGLDSKTLHATQKVIRFDADGEFDRSFGNNGWLPLRRGFVSSADSAVARPDGSVVVGGSVRFHDQGTRTSSPFVPSQLALSRYR